MANLIIKPAGNGSLILQDEGGDAALTVGTTGSTTLAGTANNVGTVTAGSIAGGSITNATTFPAGHVIQQVSTLYEPSGDISTSSTSFQASAFFLTITPTNAANDICMCFHLNGTSQSSTSANGIVDIQRSINGASYTQMGGLKTYAFSHTYNVHATSSGIVFTDTNFSGWTTGTIVYKLYFRTDNASHAFILTRGNTSSAAWAMEIKR